MDMLASPSSDPYEPSTTVAEATTFESQDCSDDLLTNSQMFQFAQCDMPSDMLGSSESSSGLSDAIGFSFQDNMESSESANSSYTSRIFSGSSSLDLGSPSDILQASLGGLTVPFSNSHLPPISSTTLEML